MNQTWTKSGSFESEFCSGTIYSRNMELKLTGSAKSDFTISCAAPPDFRQSYSGSALPAPSATYAFGHGAQSQKVKTNHSGRFSVRLVQPNSFYQGNDLIPPTVYITNGEERIAVQVAESIPNRSLHSLVDRPSRSSGR